MIGSDFKPTVLLKHERRCSECGFKMKVGNKYLASIKNGKIKKWVCSEECRTDFDARIWQVIANTNERRRREKHEGKTNSISKTC